jgi:hypothetical protein
MSRRYLVTALLTLIICQGFSQSITNYTFSATNGTFTTVSGATAPTLTGDVDQGYFNNIPVGFDYWYNGIRYTTVSAATDGYLTLGQNISSINGVANLAASGNPRPVIAPLWDDLSVNLAANVTYVTTGTAPSRVFTLQWLNVSWSKSAPSSNGGTISFQVKLYESTGRVQFVYMRGDQFVSSGNASIGITASGTGSGNFLALNNTGTAPGVSSTLNTTGLNAKPADGQTYTFTPPVPSANPASLSFTAVSNSSTTLNWTETSTNETGFVIYRSTDGINYSFAGQTAANATSSIQAGLAFGTLYYWNVYAVTEGALSAAISGSQATAASCTQAPTTAAAGANQTGASTCGLTTVTLAANTPTVGTGAWSIISGAGGTVTTPTSPTSTFSGTAGTSYTLRWTISSNPCTATTSDVVITFSQAPTTSVAGPNQSWTSTCGLTSVTLAANTPTVGTGAWSIVSGTGGTVTTPTSPTSNFSGTAGSGYTLRWTISSSPCTSTSDVLIIFNRNPTTSNAGTDRTSTCGATSIALAANAPAAGAGTGAWSIVSGTGGTVTTPSSRTSNFTGISGTSYTLRWTISNDPCPASTDDVVINFIGNSSTSNAGPDQTGAATCGLTSVTLAANAPTIGTGAWSIMSGVGAQLPLRQAAPQLSPEQQEQLIL